MGCALPAIWVGYTWRHWAHNWGITLQGDDSWVFETGWRWMMLSLSIPAMAFFYLSFSVPESPSWLVKKGRLEQARKLLARSAEPEEVREILEDLARQVPDGKPAPMLGDDEASEVNGRG